MIRKIIGVLIAATAMALLPASATATLVTIDFEDLAIPSGTQLDLADGVSQDSGGFTFTPGPNNDSGFDDLHFHDEDGFGLNGTQNLGTHDDVVMTRVGGGTFSLLAFEYQGHITEFENILIHALLEDGTTFTASFLTDAIPSPLGVVVPYDSFDTTFPDWPASGFVGLISLTWEVPNGSPHGENGFFLDNIIVDIDTNGQVPEPAGITLLMAGLVALYSRRRA